ncbi:MAG: beta-ketoacyl synthase N-terminal-like domain-containing protein, partial [Nitrospinota bacterium]
MSKRRVVVTGLGLITPLGNSVEETWNGVISGKSGIGPITRFDTTDFPVRIAGEVKDFDPEEFIERKEIKKMDIFIQYAIACASMAMKESGLVISEANCERVGVMVGAGIGGLPSIEKYHKLYLEKGV